MIEVVHANSMIYTHDHSRSCPRCEGRGFVDAGSYVYDPRVYGSPTVYDYANCRDCNGTGAKSVRELDLVKMGIKKEPTQ